MPRPKYQHVGTLRVFTVGKHEVRVGARNSLAKRNETPYEAVVALSKIKSVTVRYEYQFSDPAQRDATLAKFDQASAEAVVASVLDFMERNFDQ